ncbi:hypothetical protein ABSA28_00549 [Candidatus Hepatincolaceae symbiont of Richtersius coronifer]
MFRLEFTPITANNIATFNAYINAVRCDNFIKFSQYYDKDFTALFKNVTIFLTKGNSTKIENEDNDIFGMPSVNSSNSKALGDDKGKDLSIAWSTLPLNVLKQVYEQVVKHREQEFKGVFEEKDIAFKDLSELDKVKHSLLFHYGDKLGGYAVIARLDIQELITLYKHFTHMHIEQNTVAKSPKD